MLASRSPRVVLIRDRGGASARQLHRQPLRGVEVSGGTIYVRYVARPGRDPDLQLGDRVRSPRLRGARAREGSTCASTARRDLVASLERRVTSVPGAGGLKTLRFDAVYARRPRGRQLEFRDRDLRLADRVAGDHVSARDGAATSSVLGTAPLRERRASRLPRDLLRSPLDVTAGDGVVEPGDGPGAPPSIEPRAAARRTGRRLRGADRPRRAVASASFCSRC